MYRPIIGVLAVWRLTHLLNAEDGPWDLGTRFRQRVGSGFWGTVLDCFYCLSLWVALPIAVLAGRNRGERLLLWPALSAGAILLQHAASQRVQYTLPMWPASMEDPDELLREEQERNGPTSPAPC